MIGFIGYSSAQITIWLDTGIFWPHCSSNWTDCTALPGLFWLRYITSGRTQYKTPFPTIPGGFTVPLPSNGWPFIVTCSYFAGLFTEPLPRSGSMRHNMFAWEAYLHKCWNVNRHLLYSRIFAVSAFCRLLDLNIIIKLCLIYKQ
jgi:hypothetical protein